MHGVSTRRPLILFVGEQCAVIPLLYGYQKGHLYLDLFFSPRFSSQTRSVLRGDFRGGDGEHEAGGGGYACGIHVPQRSRGHSEVLRGDIRAESGRVGAPEQRTCDGGADSHFHHRYVVQMQRNVGRIGVTSTCCFTTRCMFMYYCCTGELYTTQFFSSRKLKFILFLQPDSLQSGVLESWSAIAKTFKGKAIFSYITTPVADVLEYFNIDPSKDSPMIAAHQPTNDVKFKSDTLQSLEPNVLLQFVAGVMAGVVPKIVKSEPVPRVSGPPAPVVTAVGSNVLEIVSSQGKDVLLVVFAPWCTHCKKLIPTYEILGRAVQGEPRIVIAKINGAANDVPAAWGVKAYPTLLWFRAADKELLDDPTTVKPHPYWDAGYSLHELVGFVQRQGSFDVKTMRVASAEQLSSLLGDEEVLRAKYEVDERHQLRNQGREVYEPAQVDFLLGEVVFDGKRWHMLAAAALLVYAACLSVYVLSLTIFTAPKVPKKKIS